MKTARQARKAAGLRNKRDSSDERVDQVSVKQVLNKPVSFSQLCIWFVINANVQTIITISACFPKWGINPILY
jgi:hypothetical protein